MTISQPPTIALLGMGAIGTLLAFHWQACKPLCISRTGTSCQRTLIDLKQQPHALFVQPWQHEPLDWLVVTTKAADTLTALKPLEAQLPKVKRLLLLQNGMGQQQQVEDWLWQLSSAPELWAGISTEGAYRKDRHQVVYAGAGDTVIGRWNHQEGQATDDAPLPYVKQVDNIQQRVQAKLAINAVINPLTGLYRCRNGELVENRQYRKHLHSLADEVAQCCTQLGWQLPFNLKQRAIEVASATAANQSSTLQDMLNQRSTELAYINGFLWQQAQQHQIELPISEQLLRQLGEI